MSKNIDKFKNLVTDTGNSSIKKIKRRIKNRDILRESQHIAMMVLDRLDELNWTQKQLADKLGVSPQQVSKIVKGKENLTLDSITKIQKVLEIPILATYKKNNYQETLDYLNALKTHLAVVEKSAAYKVYDGMMNLYFISSEEAMKQHGIHSINKKNYLHYHSSKSIVLPNVISSSEDNINRKKFDYKDPKKLTDLIPH